MRAVDPGARMVLVTTPAGTGTVDVTLESGGRTATLARGFSITRTAEGKVITSASQVKSGDLILTQLAEGEIESRVKG